MTDLQTLGNIVSEFGLVSISTKDLVPRFDPKVHLFENTLLKILAQLLWRYIIKLSEFVETGSLKIPNLK